MMMVATLLVVIAYMLAIHIESSGFYFYFLKFVKLKIWQNFPPPPKRRK